MRKGPERDILDGLRSRYRTVGEVTHLALRITDPTDLNARDYLDVAVTALLGRGDIVAGAGEYLELPGTERARLFASEHLAGERYRNVQPSSSQKPRVRRPICAAPEVVARVDVE